MSEWPRWVYKAALNDFCIDDDPESGYIEVVPADLARELYEAVGFCARTIRGDYDPLAAFKMVSAEELVRKALARYEREVGK